MGKFSRARRPRIDRPDDFRIIEMSGVDEEYLVYEAEHRRQALIGFRPDDARPDDETAVLVSFARELAGMEIALDVLETLIANVRERIRQERLGRAADEAWPYDRSASDA